jgi:shikimate dehydrogenase
VFAILGDPVAHSLSPAMQNAAFRVLGLDAVYVPLRCSATDLPGLMTSLARAGGGGNVTIPHKAVAARSVGRPSAWVRAIDACNTFWSDGGGDAPVIGDNTDIEGILAALDRLQAPAGPWLLAGTGGSARAVAAAASERGATVAVTSRDAARAAGFAAWAQEALGVRSAEPAHCRVLINATPLGRGAGDPDPIPAGSAPDAAVALDLVYARGETGWVRRARARGLVAADGREVLVRQGAAAFSRWFPGKQAPIEAMRAAVHAALG